VTGAPSSTAVREAGTRSIEETLPPYVVVLHNDDVNSMDHVVIALVQSVPELTVEQAVEVMLTAHEDGRADVIACPLERAELYRDRLEAHGLTATIRRA
jgi:ATP-dependent Clp protease adaptor protein ClpS